ncbi:MAG TPA: MFS transporter, partial [Gammaproteobacteria bacterium]|nr:MFS transporter [Gammaproteobacteria bacterium]
MHAENMTPTERQAVMSISSMMALRMIGLFMVLPVFTLYAQNLSDSTPLLIGIAMGIYGLTQALCQLPFGWLSDQFGRRPLILFGLLLFIAGSLIAAYADSIYSMMLGRALQGMGAVGSTMLALLADLTRENQRTKSMAIAGITIGFSFFLAMLLGPVLAKWLAVNQLFLLGAAFAAIAIGVLYSSVPNLQHLLHNKLNQKTTTHTIYTLLSTPALAKLNLG